MEAKIKNVQLLKDGDRNSKFFLWMASASSRSNRINVLMDGDVRLNKKEKIILHILKFYYSF